MFGDRSKTSGIIGLGIIGSRIAAKLQASKVHVYVWNRTPKAEANFVASPEEMATLTDFIQIFVADGEALGGVIDALSPKLTPKHTVINHSTVGLDDTLRAAEIVDKSGAVYLDAPFTGSKVAAEDGQLTYYVGGDLKGFESARPLLEKSSKEILYFGEVGHATVLKIATNMISATTVQVLAEALAVVRAQGIDPAHLSEALEHNASGSLLTAMKLPSMLAGDYAPHFSLKNMFKDAQFALDLASAHDIDLPALSTTSGSMLDAIGRGMGELDYSVINRAFESEAAHEAAESAAQDDSEAAPQQLTPSPGAAAASESKEDA